MMGFISELLTSWLWQEFHVEISKKQWKQGSGTLQKKKKSNCKFIIISTLLIIKTMTLNEGAIGKWVEEGFLKNISL